MMYRNGHVLRIFLVPRQTSKYKKADERQVWCIVSVKEAGGCTDIIAAIRNHHILRYIKIDSIYTQFCLSLTMQLFVSWKVMFILASFYIWYSKIHFHITNFKRNTKGYVFVIYNIIILRINTVETMPFDYHTRHYRPFYRLQNSWIMQANFKNLNVHYTNYFWNITAKWGLFAWASTLTPSCKLNYQLGTKYANTSTKVQPIFFLHNKFVKGSNWLLEILWQQLF